MIKLAAIGVEALTFIEDVTEDALHYMLNIKSDTVELHPNHLYFEPMHRLWLDVLEAIGTGKGPMRSLLTLGYAGWGPGQLEGEIANNGWLTAPAPPDLVFDPVDGGKWTAALAEIGVDPQILSGDAGHA